MKTASRPHVVIAGAGFGGISAFRHLHRWIHKTHAARVTIVNRTNYFLFTPLLHEVATGGVARENVVEPLREHTACCETDFFLADVESVSFSSAHLATSTGQIAYDYLVLALGSQTNFFDTPGAREHCFELKDLADAVRLKNHVIRVCEYAAKATDVLERKRLLHFVVVGGGATGVELACELADFIYLSLTPYYRSRDVRDCVRISLVHRGAELIPQFAPRLREKALSVLRAKRVVVHLESSVVAVMPQGVRCASGEILESATPIWVAGVRPVDVLCDVKSVRDAHGRFLVNECLQLREYRNVFVLGDAACCVVPDGNSPFPQLAQVAVKEAACVSRNIRGCVEGKPLSPFQFRSSGMLISLGKGDAAGQIVGIPLFGPLAWWLWRTVYLFKLLSVRKKLRVALDWTLDLFGPRDISELD